MLTMQEIRNNLKEIQYYYAKQKIFDGASNIVGQSSVVEKANRYNKAICKAPVRLYELYISIYVNNNTQETVAEDWDCSLITIWRLNKMIYEFLQKTLSDVIE